MHDEFKLQEEEQVTKYAFKVSDVKKKLEKLTKDQDRKKKKA